MEVEMEDTEHQPPAAPSAAAPGAARPATGTERVADRADAAGDGPELSELENLLDEARTIAHRLFLAPGEPPSDQEEADGVRLAQLFLELDEKRSQRAAAEPLPQRIDPDAALAWIRELVARLRADLYTADDQAEADLADLAGRVHQLDRWLVDGGLFPAAWEDSHPWVKLRREVANANAQYEGARQHIEDLQRRVEQLQQRAALARELLGKFVGQEPAAAAVVDAALARLDGRTP